MQKNICNKENIENVLKMVKSLSINEIQTLWIDKNLPCEFIRGLEYKGKQRIKIDAEIYNERNKNVLLELANDIPIYHLSESNLDGKILKPRIPENFMTRNGYEEY